MTTTATATAIAAASGGGGGGEGGEERGEERGEGEGGASGRGGEDAAMTGRIADAGGGERGGGTTTPFYADDDNAAGGEDPEAGRPPRGCEATPAGGRSPPPGDAGDAEGGVRTMDVSEYNGILALGGDGILSEILQGIHRRESASSSTAGAAGASAGAGVGATIDNADGGVRTMDVSEYDGILALGGDGILSKILQGSDGDAGGGGQWWRWRQRQQQQQQRRRR